MKLHQLIMVFLIIVITVIIVTDIKTNGLKLVAKNKEQFDKNLDTAIDDGTNRLAEVDDNNQVSVSKDAAINSFFLSLNSSFGTLEDKKSRDQLNMYVPIVVITTENGYYAFYSEEYKDATGGTCISKQWSELLPYDYADENFIYRFTLGDVVTICDNKNRLAGGAGRVYTFDYHDFQSKEEYAGFREANTDCILLNEEAFEYTRKGATIKSIETTMAYYTSRHNRIARRYGITYNFSLPIISYEEWAPYLNEPSMFVVFQGYPYQDGTGATYNRFASAAAKLTKKNMYYLEQKSWYLIYHRSNCNELRKEGLIFHDEPLYRVEDCAAQGAYACPECSKGTGVYAPEYVVNE